jgi:hypothetical protein
VVLARHRVSNETSQKKGEAPLEKFQHKGFWAWFRYQKPLGLTPKTRQKPTSLNSPTASVALVYLDVMNLATQPPGQHGVVMINPVVFASTNGDICSMRVASRVIGLGQVRRSFSSGLRSSTTSIMLCELLLPGFQRKSCLFTWSVVVTKTDSPWASLSLRRRNHVTASLPPGRVGIKYPDTLIIDHHQLEHSTQSHNFSIINTSNS